LWTYGRTCGWTDTPEFQSTRSSPGDDLKIKGHFGTQSRVYVAASWSVNAV